MFETVQHKMSPQPAFASEIVFTLRAFVHSDIEVERLESLTLQGCSFEKELIPRVQMYFLEQVELWKQGMEYLMGQFRRTNLVVKVYQ